MNNNRQSAFTFMEILIVVAVLSIIVAIAIPSYKGSREKTHRNTCIANLRQINSAIDQWAIEEKIVTGVVPSGSDVDEIYSYLKGSRPRCPSGGEYSMNGVGEIEQVTCSLSDRGHAI